MSDSEYRFIDSGGGRRLESFAGVICDRVAPMAVWEKGLPEKVWNKADIYFDKEKKWRGEVPARWGVSFPGIKFSLEQTSNGQVGVFPEQKDNWEWINSKLSIAATSEKLNVLNCFAHTGGSTLAAARSGAEVVHVDAAKSVNTRARENARISGLGECPIRWITEDALKFMLREHKRKNYYDAIILDPPAFGRMGRKIWKFEKDMPQLLATAVKLLAEKPLFFLLTMHQTGWGKNDLMDFINKNSPELLDGKAVCQGMELTGEGSALSLGFCLRVEYR